MKNKNHERNKVKKSYRLHEIYYNENDPQKYNKEKTNYFKNIFEDKLKLYHYCEYQLNRIAFANSIFIAALAVLISGNNEMKLNIWTVILFIPFIVSLGITLWCAIPKFFGSRLSYRNTDHRSVYGIEKFKDVEDYKKYISNLTVKDTYEEIITQIYNMNNTIINDYKRITAAVIFGIIGLLAFICYLLFNFAISVNFLY